MRQNGKQQQNDYRRSARGGALLLLLAFAFLLASCGSPAAETAKEPVSLDLSNTGLNDVTDLLTQMDLTALDLRGDPISVEQYQSLVAALPNCDILWSVPVGSQRVESDATTAVLTGSVDALETTLAFLPELVDVKFADADAQEYASLIAFAANHPELSVRWDVKIGGISYPQNTESLDLTATETDAATLLSALSGLPMLSEVKFSDDLAFTTEDQLSLQTAYPQISFLWNVALLDDFSVFSDATEIDLRGYTVSDVDTFSDMLALLPNLTYADMCNCGPGNEEMAALRERYPAVKFVWMIRVADWEIRTDIKGFSTGQRYRFPDGGGSFVADKLSYQSFRSSDFENLKYCTDLIALDVGHCSKIGDVDFIAGLPKLKYLVLTLCDISDISSLAGQTDLEFVEIKCNYINDLSPLAACTKIRFLNCANNEISDFSVLSNMPDLERLWINMNNFTKAEAEALQAAMPNTEIKASLTNPDYAESLWRKGNEGYLAMQELFGMRAQNQGSATTSGD